MGAKPATLVLALVVDQTVRRTPLDPLALAAYLVVFGAVAWAASRRPALGIAALIALDPFALYRDIGRTTITLPKVALLAFALALLWRRSSLRSLHAPNVRLLGLCALAVVAADALSIAGAQYRIPALRETLKAFEYLALFALVALADRADPDERPLRLALAGSLGVVALVALAQAIAGAPSVTLLL
ncbi:MAG: hypothetical protein ACREM2_09955, partial [Vulcanimicrobiaceae bacterium]